VRDEGEGALHARAAEEEERRRNCVSSLINPPHHTSTNREIFEAIYKDLRKPEAEADMTEVRA